MAKEKTQKKKRPSHGVISDYSYIYGILWKEETSAALLFLFWMLVLPVNRFIYPFISKYAMEIITVPALRNRNIGILAALLLIQLAAEIFIQSCTRYNDAVIRPKTIYIFTEKLMHKRMAMDYQTLEQTSVNDSGHRAMDACANAIPSGLYIMRTVFSDMIQVILYTAVLAGLSPVMILTAGAPAAVCFFINRHVAGWQWRNADKWTHLDRQLDYLCTASSDFSYAKDMRLYGMRRWLHNKFGMVWKERLGWYKKYDRQMTAWKVLMDVINAASLFLSYAITVYMVFHGRIGAGDFVLYFSSISNYGNAVWLLAEGLSSSLWIRDNINYYRDYLDIPDKCGHGRGVPLPEGDCELEFKNVSYTYPNAERPTVRNISFRLRRGEKLALVGLNGAGKSTLIKLMCGLYDPTEGEILLDGVDVRRFDRDEYFRLFSTVFQDFDMLPMTVAQNISQERGLGHGAARESDIVQEKVEEALRKAGLYEKIKTLPQGTESLLARSVFDGAVDLSGGERQKLALARALYKNAPILLLDEPTAALDPISEQRMYQQYAEFSENKASVFISHRLASTRFCDRILLIEDGRIAEQGNHGELMRQNGKYAALFEIQSAYYRKEAEDRCIREAD